MADRNSKFKENKPGKYYVDDQCIACDACVIEAPHFFEMDQEEGHAFVKAQPQTEKDLELCDEALENCPVSAIGDDGDEN